MRALVTCNSFRGFQVARDLVITDDVETGRFGPDVTEKVEQESNRHDDEESREGDSRLHCPLCFKILAEELDGTLNIKCRGCRIRIRFDINGSTVLG